jgi:hypothetical protein
MEVGKRITVFTHIIFAHFWSIFSSKRGGVKTMRGIFGRRCFRGDFQDRSRIRYPIHKPEMKYLSIII